MTERPDVVGTVADLRKRVEDTRIRWFEHNASRLYDTGDEDGFESDESDADRTEGRTTVVFEADSTRHYLELVATLEVKGRELSAFIKVGSQAIYDAPLDVDKETALAFLRADQGPWLLTQAWQALSADTARYAIFLPPPPLPHEQVWEIALPMPAEFE